MNTEPSEEDLAKVQALQQKRILAFLNHSVMTNVLCLNNFMQVCEEKLMQFEQKLDKVDAAMVILESKLISVPEVSSLTAESTPAAIEPEPTQEETSDTTNALSFEAVEMKDITNSSVSRPEYDRFVKMVQVGVPLQAAKLKCALEGLDPEVLASIIEK